jgi:hypothetical protein
MLGENESAEPAITYIRGSPFVCRGIDLLRPGPPGEQVQEVVDVAAGAKVDGADTSAEINLIGVDLAGRLEVEAVPAARADADHERLAQSNGGSHQELKTAADESKGIGTKSKQCASGTSTPPRCAVATTPVGSNVYTCEWCTFQGRFNDVVLHERACSAKEDANKGDAQDAHEKSLPPPSGSPDDRALKAFECDRQCGFQGSFEDVLSHERGCAVSSSERVERPTQHAAPDPPPPAVTGEVPKDATHTCESRCGFKGTFDEVVAHEQVCKHGATHTCELKCGFKGTFDEVVAHEQVCKHGATHTCELKCGFKGTFDEVVAHEQVCKPAPTHTCVNLCGFRGSYEAVAQHEMTCTSRARSC